MFDEAFASLFEINMGIRTGERILVFADTIREDEQPDPRDLDRRIRLHQTAEEMAVFARKTYGSGSFVSFPATAASGAEPPEVLWEAAFGSSAMEELRRGNLLEKLIRKEAAAEELAAARDIVTARSSEAVDVVIGMANNSTSHTNFRALASAAGTRYASLPHFDPQMFFGAMQVDWQALAERTKRLAAIINEGIAITVTTPAGTSIRLGKSGRIAEGDDGILTERGSFGNLPAGEVFLAPREGTSEGTIVLEYAPMRKLAAPLELVVQEGNVVEIRGDEPHREKLERKFAESAKNRNIAELGIGTNDRATQPDNILEAEKILGTVHIALGDNLGFGGTVSTPFHEDYVLYHPTLTIIREDGTTQVVLENGIMTL